MGLRAFSRHKVWQLLEFRDKSRRLRILYNRIMLFGRHPFYSYWAAHEFLTKLGLREFICTTVSPNAEDEFLEYYYMDRGKVLFKIQIYKNLKKYRFLGKYEGYSMTEQEAWLAIYELEELSYKEMEVKIYDGKKN